MCLSSEDTWPLIAVISVTFSRRLQYKSWTVKQVRRHLIHLPSTILTPGTRPYSLASRKTAFRGHAPKYLAWKSLGMRSVDTTTPPFGSSSRQRVINVRNFPISSSFDRGDVQSQLRWLDTTVRVKPLYTETHAPSWSWRLL